MLPLSINPIILRIAFKSGLNRSIKINSSIYRAISKRRSVPTFLPQDENVPSVDRIKEHHGVKQAYVIGRDYEGAGFRDML